MKSKLFLFFIIFLTLFNFNSLFGKESIPLTLSAKVDKHSITIGDKVKYTILVSTRNDIDIKFPKFGENLSNFSIIDFGSSKRVLFGRKRIVQWYLLDTYKTGEFFIPRAKIEYKKRGEKEWHEIETNKVKISVKSVLGNNNKSYKIREIKGPINFPMRLNPLLLAIGIFLVFTSGSSLFLLKRKGKKEEVIPKKPPDEIAHERLKRLKAKGLVETGKIKEYYIELSDIVRHYLEDRFSIRAPEMTTEEFLMSVSGSKEILGEHKDLLGNFLSHCDMVKFAKYGPSKDEINSSFESAVKLIDKTKG